jgi:tetratricopeptide (TPR) repeat protein
VLARVRQRLSVRAPQFVREKAEAPERLAELLAQPPMHRELLVRNSERFVFLALGRALVTASARRAPSDLEEADSIGHLAVRVAERLDVELYGRGMVADTLALAWAQIADCRRRGKDYPGAEAALARAHKEAEIGSGECQVSARLLAVEASLRRHQMLYEESERLFQQAVRLYRSSGDGQRLGQALVEQAELIRDVGKPRQARWLIRQGLRQLQDSESQQENLEARLLLVECEAELGNHGRAARMLEELREPATNLSNERLALRWRWLEGRVAAGLGRMAEAEAALLAARRGFESLGEQGESALVALDLAAIYHRCGRRAEMTEVISKVLPYFAMHASHRELSAASRRLLEASGAMATASVG